MKKFFFHTNPTESFYEAVPMGTAFFVQDDRIRWDLQDERATPQGECPVDIQAREPQSGWDGRLLVRKSY